MVVVLALPPAVARAGKLEDTRSAARENGGRTRSSGPFDENGDGDDESEALLCFFPLFLPFCIAAWAADSRDDRTHQLRVSRRADFAPFPYAVPHVGHLVLRREEVVAEDAVDDPEARFLADTAIQAQVPVSNVAGRASAEYYYDLDTVHVPGLRLFFDSTSRLGVDTGWRLFLEPRQDAVDKLVMGHLNLTIRLLQHPTAEMHLGLGGRLMAGGQLSGGFNGALRFVLFPKRPLLVMTDAHMGNLGYAFFLEGQAALGVTWRMLEGYAGYRGTLLLGRERTVAYHGPIIGIALWF